ncbi:MAG: ABC transporter permease [Bacteroidaceae bacterium]|nr:ABC transporter permease [Bacteroidaceae bacterium]
MRFDIDSCNEILDSLLRNKRRSLLTGFGIFWGLFMLLFMLGGGDGLKAMLEKNFDGFATNTTILASDLTSKPYKGFKEGRYWNLSVDDIDRLRMMVPELRDITPVISLWGQTAINGENTVSGHMKGVGSSQVNIEAPKLKYGRFINDIDVMQYRKVCVIGKRIYTSLFPDGGDPCGSFIRVGSVYFKVIGVDYNSSKVSINGTADEAITIPFSVAQTLYHMGDNIHLICMTGKSGVQMSTLEKRIRQVMARQHQFDPTDEQAMFVLNTEQMFAIMDNLFKGVNFLIWLVGLGTLFAGAIGVSNIMMVTVKERTTEIGIRRAIGATPVEILSQILAESILLTIVAGFLSIMFSVMLLNGLEAAIHNGISFQISFGTAVSATLLLVILGAAAGLAPALRAMRIKPVEAMHDE